MAKLCLQWLIVGVLSTMLAFELLYGWGWM